MEIIKFYPWGTGVNPLIHSAAKEVAPYWKELPRFHGKDDAEKIRNGTAEHGKIHMGLKNCMPYFDAMTAGYHYQLHTDIYITKINDKNADASWTHELFPLTIRPSFEMPTPHGHYDTHFSWQMHWGISLPAGWSALVTHPLNRYDLPFTTTSGIADFDTYPMPGNISFHIKDNFEGVIRAGTPIFTILPIKRETWVSEVDINAGIEGHRLAEEKKTMVYGNYKKNYRQEKRYD